MATSSSHGGTARAILYAFLANGGIAIAKTWAAWITGSGSMLAEAIHSYADTGNQVLLFLGLKQSGRAPDAEHPLPLLELSELFAWLSIGGGSNEVPANGISHDEWVAALLTITIVVE